MDSDLAKAFARLEQTREGLLAEAGRQGEQAFNRPPRPQAWSAAQALHHVVTSEMLTLGYIRKKMQAGDALPRPGLPNTLRLLALRAFLASPLRAQAPKVSAEVPERVGLAELRSRWDQARADWRDLLETFPDALLGRLVFRHPFAGLFTLLQTLSFLQAHLDHHARQVRAALRAGGPR